MAAFPIGVSTIADSGMDKFVTGMLFGAAVGAAIGLLVAPKPGSETRQLVRERATEYAGPVRERPGEFVGTAREPVSNIRRRNNQDSVEEQAAVQEDE